MILNRDRFAILSDIWGRFRSLSLIAPVTPDVGPGDDGFLWIDIGVDGTPSAPLWKMWDEYAATWRVIGGSQGSGMTIGDHLAIGDSAPHHAAVTLNAAADTLLGLNGQQVTLDAQAANTILAGPTSGSPDAPTFRSLVAADIAQDVAKVSKLVASDGSPDPAAYCDASGRLKADYGADVTGTFSCGSPIYVPVVSWIYHQTAGGHELYIGNGSAPAWNDTSGDNRGAMICLTGNSAWRKGVLELWAGTHSDGVNGGIVFYTGNTNQMVITRGGRVGFNNIWDPLDNLEVNGCITVRRGYYHYSLTTGNTTGYIWSRFDGPAPFNENRFFISFNFAYSWGQWGIVNSGFYSNAIALGYDGIYFWRSTNPGGFPDTRSFGVRESGVVYIGILAQRSSSYVTVYRNLDDGFLSYPSSDRRLKTNIQPYLPDDASDLLVKLRPVSFNWKADGVSDLGLVAQDVAEVYPNAVFEMNGYYGINYEKFIPVLIAAYTGLQEKIKILEEKYGSNSHSSNTNAN